MVGVPISPAQVAKLKNEKKAKEREKREIESNNRRHLANVRVVQKNLVYVIGLPNNLASDDVSTLRSHDYFGQFGRINKIVINRRQNGSGGSSTTSNPQHPSVGVYVTYATKEEATRAINAVDGSLLDGRVLRATFGTTKYCSYYLRNIPCQNPGCMYLHEPGEEADSFTKEDLAANRAELRDVPREAFDHDDDYPAGRAINQSPNTHQVGGRATASAAVSVSSLPGFQNNRPQSVVTTAAAAVPQAQLSMAATNAATRLRKASELSGLRPRSVEPHGNDGDGGSGSALPATASWATRAMSKKSTNEPPEPKPRRSDTGGTMTLRMIPSSRNKAACASTTTTKPSGAAAVAPAVVATAASGSNISPTILSASSVSTRERPKTATAATVAATSDAAATLASGAGIQHHPTLQQLSRERKQQQRHQTRAQQKQARQVYAEDIDADGDTETDIDVDSETDRKRNSAASKAASKAIAVAAAAASATSVSASNVPAEKSSQPQQREIEPVAAAITVQEVDATAAEALAPSLNTDAVPELPVIEVSTEPTQQPQTIMPVTTEYDQGDTGVSEGYVLQTESQEQSTAAYDAIQAANHTSSALSFQSITDSLFAQLNAKVSTPPTSNLPVFSGAGGSSSSSAAVFDGHVGGIRNPAGYPVSSVDPLLFPPMGMSSNDVSSAGYGRMDSGPQFSVFGSQSNTQWGRLGMVPGGYAPTSLSSVLAGPPALGPPPMGSLGEAPPSTGGLGAFSRQRSRWDFVHADEASAQAELQSVLGRGPGDKSAHLQQQQHGPPAGSFMSSRDLGMFSTPIQTDYSGRQWSGSGQQSDGYAVPHPPPGFGGRQRSDLMRAAESSALPMLGSGTPPGGVIGGGSNTLLSRLMGQTSGGLDVSGASGESGLPASHYPMAQSQQYHGYQDPAILSSYAAPPASMNSMQAMASNASMGNMQQATIQQQQQARGRGDPNVLSSLLARLHLGQGEGASPLAAMGSQAGPASMSFMSQPMGHRGSIGSGSMAPPGIEPMGVAGSPVYNSALGQTRMQQQQPQMAMGRSVMPLGLNTNAGGGGFADPAIMHMGRVNVSSGPTSPVGLPPGILSPQSADSAGGSAGGYVGQMQPMMVSRSANSSGRSRFLNHFSPDGVPSNASQQQQQQQQPIQPSGSIENNAQSPVDEKSESEVEAGNNNMVNGVPPGLPTTGLFGELLRRAKLEAAAVSGGGNVTTSAPLPASGSTYVSGKMMLSDIERKLDAARREARDLQAQLSTVIGQNQSAMWALANGSTSPAGGMDKATGFGFSAAGSVATDAVDEQELISRFPEIEYICGQPPRRPEGATFYYARKEVRVQRSLLSELICETWITQEIQYYVYMLTLLGFEASRLMLLHLQLHFENKPGIPLPKIDKTFIGQFFRALRNRSQATNARRGRVRQDVLYTLRIYESTYSDLGFHASGCTKTMTQFINYMVNEYKSLIELHATKRMGTPAAVVEVLKHHPSGLLDVGGIALALLETFRTRRLYVERIASLKNLKDKEAVPGRTYFNNMIMTDGVGASISTFRWVRKTLRKPTSEAPTAAPGPSIAALKSVSQRKRKALKDLESSSVVPSSSARSAEAPASVASSTSVPPIPMPPAITCPEFAPTPTTYPAIAPMPAPTTYPVVAPVPAPLSSTPLSSKPSTVLPSRAGGKRKHTPEPASNAGYKHVSARVQSPAPVRTPGPEPHPPVSTTEPEPISIIDPPDNQVVTSQETIEATLATAADGLDDALAALDEWNAKCHAYLAKREAAARKAKTFDRAEYYAEQKRNAIYDREREGVTIAYEMAIRAAEAAAGPELTRTEAQAADLEAARKAAMETALRDLDIAHSIAIDEVDAAQRKNAATRAAIHDPSHVHIGGDPGSYSISAKQYHADSGSTWRAAEMNRLSDRFDLWEWMSRIPSSKTASSENDARTASVLVRNGCLQPLYRHAHDDPGAHYTLERAYEQKRSAIAKCCNKVMAGCTRENTTIDMGDAKLHNMRGCLPCPRANKPTDYWHHTGWRVVTIKENNTSQVCSTCMTRLPAGQAPVRLCTLGDEHTKHCYKVRVSNNHFVRHCSVCGTTWNRDVNAARNMAYLGYLLALGLPRPWYFMKHLEDPPVHYQVLYRSPVARDSLLPGDQAPFPAYRPAPVYRTPIHRSDMPLADKVLFPACNRVPVYREHRVRHYAHRPHPTPKPAREPSLRFKHPLARRSLLRNDQGPFPACARRDPRPPKPQNERPRWMPTSIRAGQLRQAENIREAKEARIRRVANSDMSRLTKQFAHLNLAGKPRLASLKRAEVDEKRTAWARAVSTTLYERTSG
ncbi:transcriptional repressor general negative regulator of transcription subunit 4 [Coemansia sp. S146]|nr:transcriptional repressor general negative regulator of transcription subunit 4 [Coemansia sp. S146]